MMSMDDKHRIYRATSGNLIVDNMKQTYCFPDLLRACDGEERERMSTSRRDERNKLVE